MSPWHWLAHSSLALAAVAAATACGSLEDVNGPDPVDAPLGADAVQPFPMDRGDDGATTPGSYKGLWLRLVNNGAPIVTAVDGIIGVVCIGMSNANQECGDFIARRNGEYAAAINPAVRVVNCAVGSHAIERWIDPAFDGTLWDACITTRLPAAGVRLDQVRVIYHKAANQFTTGAGGVPLPMYPAAGSDYQNFLGNLSQFAARVNAEFPAVQAVYTSSRSYGGFAGSANRGEPLSYEEGHALNSWLRANPSVAEVWYGWGPYLWAPACDTGITNKGGVCYDRQDYVADGVHPAPPGRAKMSALLHARLLREAWYRR
ncbi:MAG: hypothetical protein ABR602_08460 [Gemmatimonadales bacterium]